MKTSEMSAKLRRLGRNTRIQVLNHQDCLFLLEAADRLDEQEERIAIRTEPREATEEQLRFEGGTRA